jgi:hypothetical protein
MNTSARKRRYKARYVKVVKNLSNISKMKPEEKYMYRLMDTVIFHDFETALDVVIEDFKEAHNDNEKKA